MRGLRTTLSAAIVSTVMFGTSVSVGADDEGTIKYRQSIMKVVGGHFGAIFQLAKGKVDYPGQLVIHANGLASTSKQVVQAFETRTEGGKTRSKAEIWQDFDGFKAKAQDFVKAAGELNAAVGSGDQAAVAEKLDATLDTCKSCHKKFRKKAN